MARGRSLVSFEELVRAGVHLGHKPQDWNPKMRDYICSERWGVSIIDLRKSISKMRLALEVVSRVGRESQTILFVNTKKKTSAEVCKIAKACMQPYVTTRWLGGMLTNFSTIRNSIKKMKDLEDNFAQKTLGYTKKEINKLRLSLLKKKEYLEGIKMLCSLPDYIFIFDVVVDRNAVKEAKKKLVPSIGIVDTNGDPSSVDFPVPGNDDSNKCIRLYGSLIVKSYYMGVFEKFLKTGNYALIEQIKKNEYLSDDFKSQVLLAVGKYEEEVAIKRSSETSPSERKQSRNGLVTTKKQADISNRSEKEQEGEQMVSGREQGVVSTKVIKELRSKTGVGISDCKEALLRAAGNIDKAVVFLREKAQKKAQKFSVREVDKGAVFIEEDTEYVYMFKINSETDFVARNSNFLSFVQDKIFPIISKNKGCYSSTLPEVQHILEEMSLSLGERIFFKNISKISKEPNVVVGSYIHNKLAAGAGMLGVIVPIIFDKKKKEELVVFAKNIAMQIAAYNPLGVDKAMLEKDLIEKKRKEILSSISGKSEEIKEKILSGKMDVFFKENLLVEQKYLLNQEITVKDFIANFEKDNQLKVKIGRFSRMVIEQ